jgi:phytoene desaturase
MNLFVLINAPAHTGAINWQREAAGYGDLVIRKLERMGLPELSRHIRYRKAISPADLAERYNAPGGAIYGLASNNPWTAFLRPPLRARDTKGLYFVGGGTHPGGGIPLVLLSGGAVAKRVLHDNP